MTNRKRSAEPERKPPVKIPLSFEKAIEGLLATKPQAVASKKASPKKAAKAKKK